MTQKPTNTPTSTVQRIPVLWITCPTCGAGGFGPEFILRGWDGKTYGFACGHEHHLNDRSGGAKSELRLVEKDSGV